MDRSKRQRVEPPWNLLFMQECSPLLASLDALLDHRPVPSLPAAPLQSPPAAPKPQEPLIDWSALQSEPLLEAPIRASANPDVARIYAHLAQAPGDWRGAAQLCCDTFFHPAEGQRTQVVRKLEEVLIGTQGQALPLPAARDALLPLLVAHSYGKDTRNAKRFYYLLWHLEKPQEHGGRMTPVQCLNGPYRGQHWARVDEAMRCNEIWAYATSEPRSRSNSLTLGVNPKKDIYALTPDGRWLQLCRFPELRCLDESVFALRDDGYSYRADLHPFPAFWPPQCSGSVAELVKVYWSQEHWDCNALGPNGFVPCRCGVTACYHPPLKTLTTKVEVKPLLHERGNPHSRILPHPRRLLRQEYWIRHEGTRDQDNWYDAIAYELVPIYKK